MKTEKVVQIVKDILEDEVKSVPDSTLFSIVRSTLDVFQGWISEELEPAPTGVHLRVSMDGVHLCGVLCNKRIDGKWYDVYGNKTPEGFVKFYRYLVFDTD